MKILRKVFFKNIIFLSLFILCFGQVFSQNSINTKEEIKSYTEHHLKDSHDFSFYVDSKTGHHVGFPLPVILWTSKGLICFMSNAFHHDDSGKMIIKRGAKLFKLHGKIYELKQGAKKVLFDKNHHPKNAHKILFNFSITKNVFGMLLVSFLLFLGFVALRKNYKKQNIPKGIGRFLEPLVLFVRDEIAKPNIGKHYKKYMSFLLTVFFFIWLSNLLGLFPLGFNITGDIAVTFCLAIFTFLIVQCSGNKNYWKHIFWVPGVPVPMKILLMPIEILGIFTKPFSLLIRLFANITAGHIVVMGLIALIYTGKEMLGGVGSFLVSFLLTLFITLIEFLVAFLQAYIFTMLSSLFIGMAVEEAHH